MEAIVAVYADWGIGAGGTQPVTLRADRKRFRALTEGAATYEKGEKEVTRIVSNKGQ